MKKQNNTDFDDLDALFEGAIPIEVVSANIPIALPPSDFISSELEYRNWSQATFAEVIGRSTKFVSQLMNNEIRITTETARLLGSVFDPPAKFWMGLELEYLEDIEKGKPLLMEVEVKSKLRTTAPMLNQAIKHNMVEPGKDAYEQEKNLSELLGVDNIHNLILSKVPQLRFARMKTETRAQNPVGLGIWMNSAKNRLAPLQDRLTSFNRENIADNLNRFRQLTLQGTTGFIEAVKVLNEYGITIIHHPKLSNTTIGGTAFWLNDKKAAIALTLRKKNLDENWFILLHELGHIMNEGYFSDFDVVVGKDASDDPKEQEANRFAERTLINQDNWDDFSKHAEDLKQQNRIIRFNEIREFAEQNEVHHSIVIGRLHFEKLIPDRSYRKAVYNESLDVEGVKGFLQDSFEALVLSSELTEQER